MNHLQPEHMRELEDFKSANNANEDELWKLENENNNRHRSSESQLRRRIPADYPHPHPSSRMSSSTARNNYKNTHANNRIITDSRKSSWINDPEVKQQRRIVEYKAYAVEGKMKPSLRNGFRLVKNKYCQLVRGFYFLGLRERNCPRCRKGCRLVFFL